MEEWEPGDVNVFKEGEDVEIEGEVTHEVENAGPEISLHALIGSMNPKTMRVLGKIGGQKVVILIDSGSTHNFLDPSIAQKAQLVAQNGEDIKVRMASGELLSNEGKSEGLKQQIQGNNFMTDSYVLSLTGYDMVLGVYWLRTLGQILWNFSELTMEFKVQQKIVKLRGLSPNQLMEEGRGGQKSTRQVRRGSSCSLLNQLNYVLQKKFQMWKSSCNSMQMCLMNLLGCHQ